MPIEVGQLQTAMCWLKDNQFCALGDFQGSTPQMLGKMREATPQQIGAAFGSMICMMEHYFVQVRSQMKDNKDDLQELEAYFEQAKKAGYSPR